jgi:hypothetical protein
MVCIERDNQPGCLSVSCVETSEIFVADVEQLRVEVRGHAMICSSTLWSVKLFMQNDVMKGGMRGGIEAMKKWFARYVNRFQCLPNRG